MVGAGIDKLFGEGADDRRWGGADRDYLFGGDGGDVLHGEAGADRMEGEGGKDYLHGDEGNDTLNGGVGDDWLWGGPGDDKLIAAAGTDEMFGGAGADVAVFSGNQTDFEIIFADDHVRVIDRNIADGDLGTTYLTDVETAQFSDGAVPLPLIGLIAPSPAETESLL